MSTDALAALLREWSAEDDEQREGEAQLYTDDEWAGALAVWLRAHNVVVLPPDHPLRTGEPGEAMREAHRAAFSFATQITGSSLALCLDAGLRAALAVLWERV